MSVKQLAEKIGAPTLSVERMIAKLDLPPCPVNLRNKRSGESRRLWTKERIILEVKKLYSQGMANSASAQQQNGSIFMAACQLFGSWRAAVEAADIEYDTVNLYSWRRTWTRASIIAELTRMHSEGISLMASDARDNNGAVFNAARREPSLGSWGAAVEAAGFDYATIRKARFGSLYQGADGFVYKSRVEGLVGERLDKLRSVGVLTTIHRQVQVKTDRGWRCDFVVELPSGERIWIEVDGLGSARSDGAYGDNHPKIQYYRRRGWAHAIIRTPAQAEQAVRDGMRGKITSLRDSPRKITQLGENRYTDEDLIKEVRRVCKLLGRAPAASEFNALARLSSQTVSHRIGWNPAVEQAGHLPRRGASKEILLGELRRVLSELGRAPTQAEFNARSSLTAPTVAARLGGWAKAVRSVGAQPIYEGNFWSKKRVISEITSLNKCLRRLTHEHLRAQGQLSVYYAAERLFGSWKLALEAAGFEPRERMVGWSRRFDACVMCSKTDNRHASRGRCVRCYEREQRDRR